MSHITQSFPRTTSTTPRTTHIHARIQAPPWDMQRRDEHRHSRLALDGPRGRRIPASTRGCEGVLLVVLDRRYPSAVDACGKARTEGCVALAPVVGMVGEGLSELFVVGGRGEVGEGRRIGSGFQLIWLLLP